jgi:hypothetical protein
MKRQGAIMISNATPVFAVDEKNLVSVAITLSK